MSDHMVEVNVEGFQFGETFIYDDERVDVMDVIEKNIACFFYCRVCGFKDENKQRVMAHVRNNHKELLERLK